MSNAPAESPGVFKELFKVPGEAVAAFNSLLDLFRGVSAGVGGAASEIPAVVRAVRRGLDLLPYAAVFTSTVGAIVVLRTYGQKDRK